MNPLTVDPISTWPHRCPAYATTSTSSTQPNVDPGAEKCR